eukprot:Gb_33308 [translate_table: standard]
MVIAKVPVEVVLVAPIWGRCAIQSQVKVVITPGVVVRPIIAHIHILVVVEALSGLIVSNDSLVISVDVSSSAVQRGGKVTIDSSRDLLGSALSSHFIIFWMGFDEKPRGLLQLVLLEMPPMALPLVDNSLPLQEGQCLQSPCHWTPIYEQDSCLRFCETRHFEGMRPFVSHFRGWVRSPCIYRVLGVTPVLWVASGAAITSATRAVVI